MSRSNSVIPPLWTALGQRLAVFVGAATALLSLVWDASVQNAGLRGGGAWLALVLLTRMGRWLIERTLPDSVLREQSDFDHGRF